MIISILKLSLKNISVMLLLGFLAASCSNTKYLQNDQELYLGAKVHLQKEGKVHSADKVKKQLEDLIRPKPNQTVFGVRPKLWFYNIAGTPKKNKGLKHFIKTKLGEPPVLFSQVDPDFNQKVLFNYLENNGFFQPIVGYEIVNKSDKKVKLKYNVIINSPYTYKEIFLPKGDSGIVKELRKANDESLLKVGGVYKLDQLKEERTRIETALKDKGYFYFKDDDLIFKVDSSVGNREVNVYLAIKPDLAPESTRKYKINNVIIYPRYAVNKDSSKQNVGDTLEIENFKFVGDENVIKPKILIKSIFLAPGDYYGYSNYTLTLNRLMNLGVYKFVNIRFEETDSVGAFGSLNMYIYLTPMPKKMIRTELRAVSQSNNFAGPQLNLSFKNRNLLKGAELLTTSFHGSFLTQISSKSTGINSLELGGDISLEIPRFIVPFNLGQVSSKYPPKTKISLGYNMTNRVDYFLINDFNGRFGYDWQEDLKRRHELYPININYYKLSNATDKFNDLIAKDALLKRSFTNQFVLGLLYTYTYNELAAQKKDFFANQFYFRGNLDISGNVAYAIQSLAKEAKPTLDTPFTLLGAPYAQYSRIITDFRYYLNFNKEEKLIFRFFPGIGIPYGNSYSLPYAKLFFLGGNNTVRAFIPRSVGPGSYNSREDNGQMFFLGEGGDMQLETNIEYRYNYTGIFNGALFVDAGNTWLIRKNEDRPGGLFNVNDFYKEIAIGAGTGLRIDASIFVLRLDVAYPLKKPYLPEGERWVKFGTDEWKLKETVFNLAIGYPF